MFNVRIYLGLVLFGCGIVVLSADQATWLGEVISSSWQNYIGGTSLAIGALILSWTWRGHGPTD